MRLKIKKTDKRFKGFPKFKYCLDLGRIGEKNFFQIREWCWQAFGSSKEIEALQDDWRYREFDHNSHNERWCWHVDAYTRRIYFATDKEANWFTLKWF